MIHLNSIARGDEMTTNTTGFAHGVEQVTAANKVPQPRTFKSRRKNSAVWEHFTIVDVSAECKRASCNHCKRDFVYSSGNKNSGTSHLSRHITESCPAIKGLQEDKSKKQSPPCSAAAGGGTENGRDGTADRTSRRLCRYTVAENTSFDKERSCSNLAKMIILHDYPLHIVEQSGFLSFVQNLQPRFESVDTNKMEGEVYAVYQRERDSLQQSLEASMPARMSLIVGSWVSSQTVGYVSLTGQFIDSDWNLHRRMLNFTVVPRPCSESEDAHALSEAISASLCGWNMHGRLFAITLDQDCSSHGAYSANLQYHLSNKNIARLDGQLFTVRCFAHTLNAVAHDVLASVASAIFKIRESIKFIRACRRREDQFDEIALQLGIASTKTLCLDVTTEWNTTYLMLVAAVGYRQVFSILEMRCDHYSEAPSTEDWRKAEATCTLLKPLYDSARRVMEASNPNPSADIFFHEACVLQQAVSNSAASSDPTVSSIARCVHWRFDSYWQDCNAVLAIAVLMDPRFKMWLAEFAYCKIYGDEDGKKHAKVLGDAARELYRAYAAQAPINGDEQAVTSTISWGVINDDLASASLAGDGALDFGNYGKPDELEEYLAEGLSARIAGFNVLTWWRLNCGRYPTLSRMARDVLAIPVSTVCSGDSVFSAATGSGARMLDDYRSSLRPEILEALFCGKDWLQYSPAAAEPFSTVQVKVEYDQS